MPNHFRVHGVEKLPYIRQQRLYVHFLAPLVVSNLQFKVIQVLIIVVFSWLHLGLCLCCLYLLSAGSAWIWNLLEWNDIMYSRLSGGLYFPKNQWHNSVCHPSLWHVSYLAFFQISVQFVNLFSVLRKWLVFRWGLLQWRLIYFVVKHPFVFVIFCS